ncbi:MAG: ComEC/Rec2 family competence protein [bacterium]
MYFKPSLIPKSYNNGDIVSYEFVLLDTPTQVGNKFRYQIGHTTIEWGEYQSLDLGFKYIVSGTIVPTIQFGEVSRLSLAAKNTQLITNNPSLNLGEKSLIFLARVRNNFTSLLARNLPEPESSLAAGILLGVKRDLSYDFRTSLTKSGTLHTVAASGYNVNIVARYILGIATYAFPHGIALLIASLGILVFCLLSGGSAAVVRAGIMGFLMLLGTGLGRQKDAKRLFIIASYSMLLVDPFYMFDVGWQLSVAATAGILYLEPILSKYFVLPSRLSKLNNILHDFWWPTIAATLATTPISLITFGQFSWIGPLCNLLILPIIPLLMSLTSIFLVIASMLPFLSSWVSPILYLPLLYFVQVVNFFGSF